MLQLLSQHYWAYSILQIVIAASISWIFSSRVATKRTRKRVTELEESSRRAVNPQQRQSLHRALKRARLRDGILSFLCLLVVTSVPYAFQYAEREQPAGPVAGPVADPAPAVAEPQAGPTAYGEFTNDVTVVVFEWLFSLLPDNQGAEAPIGRLLDQYNMLNVELCDPATQQVLYKGNQSELNWFTFTMNDVREGPYLLRITGSADHSEYLEQYTLSPGEPPDEGWIINACLKPHPWNYIDITLRFVDGQGNGYQSDSMEVHSAMTGMSGFATDPNGGVDFTIRGAKGAYYFTDGAMEGSVVIDPIYKVDQAHEIVMKPVQDADYVELSPHELWYHVPELDIIIGSAQSLPAAVYMELTDNASNQVIPHDVVGQSGGYRYYNLPNGSFTIRASAAGYRDYTGSLIVTDDTYILNNEGYFKGRNPLHIYLADSTTANAEETFRIRLKDKDDNPIPGVKLQLTPYGESGGFVFSFDSNGISQYYVTSAFQQWLLFPFTIDEQAMGKRYDPIIPQWQDGELVAVTEPPG